MNMIKVIMTLCLFMMVATGMADTPQDKIPALSSALLHDTRNPVGGNPQGNVTLVEFFDYQCSHCREMANTVETLRAVNPNLRVVYKDWPFSGPNSVYAAKAGLAAAIQGKYEVFHDALMKASLPLTNNEVLAIAKSVGIDTARLQRDMANSAFDGVFKANEQLAKELQLVGTPAFIIAKTNGADKNSSFLVPDISSQGVLQGMITQASGF